MKTPEAQRPVEPSQGSGLPGIQSWKGPLELSCSLCSLRGSQERHREGQGVVGSLRLLEDVPAQVPAHLLPLGSGTLSGHSVKARASPTTVSPSGAMIPNPGSPEAATMQGWQP